MDQLIKEYKKGKLILFVGAGVSANLGLPTWSELIGKLASDLDYDPDVFGTYGDFLALAEYYKKKKRIRKKGRNKDLPISTLDFRTICSKGKI